MAKALEPIKSETGDRWVEYRIASGEYTREMQVESPPRDQFHAVVKNPKVTLADGDEFYNSTYKFDGSEIRKATPEELATFATAEAVDKVAAEKSAVKVRFETDRHWDALVNYLAKRFAETPESVRAALELEVDAK